MSILGNIFSRSFILELLEYISIIVFIAIIFIFIYSFLNLFFDNKNKEFKKFFLKKIRDDKLDFILDNKKYSDKEINIIIESLHQYSETKKFLSIYTNKDIYLFLKKNNLLKTIKNKIYFINENKKWKFIEKLGTLNLKELESFYFILLKNEKIKKREYLFIALSKILEEFEFQDFLHEFIKEDCSHKYIELIFVNILQNIKNEEIILKSLFLLYEINNHKYILSFIKALTFLKNRTLTSELCELFFMINNDNIKIAILNYAEENSIDVLYLIDFAISSDNNVLRIIGSKKLYLFSIDQIIDKYLYLLQDPIFEIRTNTSVSISKINTGMFFLKNYVGMIKDNYAKEAIHYAMITSKRIEENKPIPYKEDVS
jgi:hypothetical protein